MAIAENPKRNKGKDTKADEFIARAGKPDEDLERKPVMLRIHADLLERIDQGARRLGLTRTGFLISSAIEKLNRVESGA
jgi:hypothetical protein